MIQLYSHQENLRAEVSGAMKRGVRRPLLVLSTGGGKTVLAGFMTDSATKRGFAPVWFVVHRKELVMQTAKAFAALGMTVGIVARGHPVMGDLPIQIVLIDSLKRRLPYLKPPKLVIQDEAHHTPANKWAFLQTEFPDIFYIGLTATPERLDGKGLGKYYDEIVEGPSMRWLIDNGFLADYRIFAPPSIDTSGVSSVGGDFNKGQLHAIIEQSTIVGDGIREYQKHAEGKRTIIRSVSIEDSIRVADEFKKCGYEAVHIDGKTKTQVRERMFNLFKSGDITHLCNVDLFSEGVDIPGVECLIDQRPTKSLILFLQFIGRGLRAAPGKEHCIYIDQVGNTERHGLPDDKREWSLDVKKKKKKPRALFKCKKCQGVFGEPFEICPICFAINDHNVSSSGGRMGPELVDGELHELNKEEFRERRKARYSDERRQAGRSLEGLREYADKHGYKQSWADHVWNARQRKSA